MEVGKIHETCMSHHGGGAANTGMHWRPCIGLRTCGTALLDFVLLENSNESRSTLDPRPSTLVKWLTLHFVCPCCRLRFSKQLCTIKRSQSYSRVLHRNVCVRLCARACVCVSPFLIVRLVLLYCRDSLSPPRPSRVTCTASGASTSGSRRRMTALSAVTPSDRSPRWSSQEWLLRRRTAKK